MDQAHLNEFFFAGNQVRIEFYDGNGSKNSFISVVHSFEVERLLLELNQKATIHFDLFKTGGQVYLISQPANNLTKFYFSAEIVEILPLERPILALTRLAKFETASRRNFFRCDVTLPLTYYLNSEEFAGKVTNLSASGFYGVISPNPNLFIGQLIRGEFLLPSISQNMTFMGRIVRLVLNDSRHQGIAINFEDAPESWQNKVIKYLFQRQRELIRHGRFKLQ